MLCVAWKRGLPRKFAYLKLLLIFFIYLIKVPSAENAIKLVRSVQADVICQINFLRTVHTSPSRDGNLHSSGMSHDKRASPKPSFRAPWRVGDAVVDGGNAGWTTSKSRHPCSCQNCSQGPSAEQKKMEENLMSPSTTPSIKELNGTELILLPLPGSLPFSSLTSWFSQIHFPQSSPKTNWRVI